MYFNTLTSCSPLLPQVQEIYFDSFPEVERRPWPKILELMDSSRSPYSLYAICLEPNKAIGLMSMWMFDDCVYIEHFAFDSAYRNLGYGSMILDLLKKIAQDRPIVLEVEPESFGEMAIKRQTFYRRNGFIAHPKFKYVQPPYSKGLPCVPLTLMTYGELDLQKTADKLHSIVYGFSTIDNAVLC